MIKYICGSLALKYTEFKLALGEGKSFPVYLLEGEDAFFKERGLSLLVNKFVSEPNLNLVTLPSDCSCDELITSLNGYPFMSEKRMTVIRDFYPKQDFFKGGLNNYLENPSDYSVLVIINDKTLDAFKKFDCVCVVECNKAEMPLLVRWIKGECAKNSVTIDAETASVLAEYCSSDMTRIETETNKLCCYVGEGGAITKTEIDEMVSRDTDYKIYEMTDYIAKKQFDLALFVIKDMLSKGESAQMIITSVYNYFRRLLHASISNMTATELAKCFSIKEYPAKKLLEQSAKFKKRALKSAVDTLTDADYRIKSGRNDADEMMWYSVFKIMTD
ncbi:MAG: DNA polymerase III subunit delta [Clostridiales bacterium]|nr:DNA polymerase III subunit delta [Clostridiales bacterium]